MGRETEKGETTQVAWVVYLPNETAIGLEGQWGGSREGSSNRNWPLCGSENPKRKCYKIF